MSHDTTTPDDLRPSRRTVTRAAAWSVPVVAAAATAPAYAASCMPLTDVTFASWTGAISNGGLTYTQTYTPPGGTATAAVDMKIAAVYTGAMKAGSETAGGPALYDVFNPVGGLGKPGLGLIQSVTRPRDQNAPGRSARGTYTFSFTKPVSNLRITFTDVDQTSGDFLDRMEIGGAVWQEVSRGSGISGGGSQTSPYAGGAAYNDGTSGAGNVAVKFAGPVSSFVVTYWNAETSWSGVDRNQAVFVADVKFDYQPC